MEQIINVPKELNEEQVKAVEAFAVRLLGLPKGCEISLDFVRVPYEIVKTFGRNQENRLIDEKHVKLIKKDFAQSKAYIPAVEVNEITNNIIDGQHRVQSFVELCNEGGLNVESDKLVVRFCGINPTEEKQRIIQMNTKVKKWQQNDYIHSFTPVNNNYSKLTKWCLNHNLCHKEGKPLYRYASAIITGSNCKDVLRKGTFEVTKEQWRDSENNYKEINSIIEASGLHPGAYIESLAIAWLTNRHLLLSAFSGFKNLLKFINMNKEYIWSVNHNTKSDWENIFFELYGRASNKVVLHDKALKDEDVPFKLLDRDKISEKGYDENDAVTVERIEDLVIPNIVEILNAE